MGYVCTHLLLNEGPAGSGPFRYKKHTAEDVLRQERGWGRVTKEKEDPMPLKLPPASEADIAQLLDNPEYAELVLARYEHWTLYLSEKQAHFGRAYAWLSKRHVDLMPFEELTFDELSELQTIIRDYRRALKLAAASPDLVNCEWLGNEYEVHRGHGHMHLIPRYKTPPFFMDREFPDPCFGQRRLSEKGSGSKFWHLRNALRAYLRPVA